jgi:KaiC/GvpD/RAD55 family RecA-like ATPase
MFKKATKTQSRARIALIGPAGSGKTYTSLAIATNLGDRVAVVDTERGSASKYADEFEFDVVELESFHPERYIEAITAASAEYDVLVIDSLSHAWMGKDGALEMVDRAAAASKSGNSYTAWRNVTPLHNQLVDAILQSRCHIIATLRSKTEYVQEKDERGKTQIRKVGLAPIQRDGMDFEFDIVGDMDADNNLVITKTRCRPLTGKTFNKPGKPLADTIKAWLTDGAPQIPDKVARFLKATEAHHHALRILAIEAQFIQPGDELTLYPESRLPKTKPEFEALMQQLKTKTEELNQYKQAEPQPA